MDTETERRRGLSSGALAWWYTAGCVLVGFGVVFYVLARPPDDPGPIPWVAVALGALVAGAVARLRYLQRKGRR